MVLALENQIYATYYIFGIILGYLFLVIIVTYITSLYLKNNIEVNNYKLTRSIIFDIGFFLTPLALFVLILSIKFIPYFKRISIHISIKILITIITSILYGLLLLLLFKKIFISIWGVEVIYKYIPLPQWLYDIVILIF